MPDHPSKAEKAVSPAQPQPERVRTARETNDEKTARIPPAHLAPPPPPGAPFEYRKAQWEANTADALQNIFADPPLSNPGAKEREPRYASAIETRQALYLAASGALMQLNALVAGILGVLLASTEKGLLKAAAGGALLLHVLSAFVLCWAARPVNGQDDYAGRYLANTVFDSYTHTDATFRKYRRGWRMTLISLAASSATAGLFVLHAFGVPALEELDQLARSLAAYLLP